MVRLPRWWPFAVLAAGLVLVAIAGTVLVGQRKHVKNLASLPAPTPIISVEPGVPTPSPSTTSVPVDGMRIQVPELGIDLPVVPGDGVNAPLYKAVLDPFLAQPGSGSRSMIYAHAQAGMFGPLFRTRVGDHVDLLRPNQPPLHYVIAQYYPRWPVNDLSPIQPLHQEQLVLVTCVTYNLNDPRQVVIANPV